MKKQSSIDILVNAIHKRFGIANCGDMEEEIQQSKQLHKQEIIESWENGYTHGASANDEPSIYHGTQYYQNTYEKEN